ncbi:hypothetical protein QJQ45_027037 [Haematococcus lacustris]|nr:hypothetical protein QJQ45_027037 [Haematococcus lacustris]
MLQLVRHHGAAAASAASSTHKRRGEDGMEPSPSRQRASRNASQDVVTKEMIDDTSPTELPALETAIATPQQSSRDVSTWGHKRPRTCLGRGAQQQLSMDQQQLQGAQHQLAQDQQQLQDAQHQLSLNQQELQGAQHQLAVDQQLLQGAQHQLAVDQQQLQNAQHQLGLNQQQLQGAQHQLAVDQQLLQDARRQVALDQQQLQGAQHQLAQALEQMQNGRTGLERSEILLRQHMDACMSDKKEDAECLELLHARAPHIASAHMTLNVHLLKEYARECLGWKGKRLTQKKPLLRADILEHLRWEQEMEEDQLAEVGVDEADDM